MRFGKKVIAQSRAIDNLSMIRGKLLQLLPESAQSIWIVYPGHLQRSKYSLHVQHDQLRYMEKSPYRTFEITWPNETNDASVFVHKLDRVISDIRNNAVMFFTDSLPGRPS